jgi:hypothetical protein
VSGRVARARSPAALARLSASPAGVAPVVRQLHLRIGQFVHEICLRALTEPTCECAVSLAPIAAAASRPPPAAEHPTPHAPPGVGGVVHARPRSPRRGSALTSDGDLPELLRYAPLIRRRSTRVRARLSASRCRSCCAPGSLDPFFGRTRQLRRDHHGRAATGEVIAVGRLFLAGRPAGHASGYGPCAAPAGSAAEWLEARRGER